MGLLLHGLLLICYGFCAFAFPRWTLRLFAGWGRRRSIHAEWYDNEIRPQIEADGDIGEIAHLSLRAKLIKVRLGMERVEGLVSQ